MYTESFWLLVPVLSSCWSVCTRQQLVYSWAVFCVMNWYLCWGVLGSAGDTSEPRTDAEVPCEPFRVWKASLPYGKELSMHSTGISALLCYGRGRRTGLVNNNPLWIKLNSFIRGFSPFWMRGTLSPSLSFCISKSWQCEKTARKKRNLLFPLNRMPSIMKCHCILFILVTTFISFLVFAKKVSLQKISNQASFRWSNKIIFFSFSFLFCSNILLKSMAGLKNECCFTLLMVRTRELALLRKTGQLSQPEQSMWWF